MRSDVNQALGLDRVAKRLGPPFRINLALHVRRGDVPVLSCAYDNAETEIVYAAQGYDVWRNGKLAQTDLSEEQAAEVLLREYIDLKTAIIVQREFKNETPSKFDFEAIRNWVSDYTRGANG